MTAVLLGVPSLTSILPKLEFFIEVPEIVISPPNILIAGEPAVAHVPVQRLFFTIIVFPPVPPKLTSAPVTSRALPLPSTLISGPFTTLMVLPLMSLRRSPKTSIVLPFFRLSRGPVVTLIRLLSSAINGSLRRTLLALLRPISAKVSLAVILVWVVEEPTNSTTGRVASNSALSSSTALFTVILAALVALNRAPIGLEAVFEFTVKEDWEPLMGWSLVLSPFTLNRAILIVCVPPLSRTTGSAEFITS